MTTEGYIETWDEFITAMCDSSITEIQIAPNTVWNMNDMIQNGNSPLIELTGSKKVYGNNLIITNLTLNNTTFIWAYNTSSSIHLYDTTFKNLLLYESKFVNNLLGYAFVLYNSKIIGELYGESCICYSGMQLYDYDGTGSMVQVRLCDNSSVVGYSTSANDNVTIIQNSILHITNGSTSTNLDDLYIRSINSALLGKHIGCRMRFGLGTYGTVFDMDYTADNKPEINADCAFIITKKIEGVTYTNTNIKVLDDPNQLKDAVYLRGLGFPIGVG